MFETKNVCAMSCDPVLNQSVLCCAVLCRAVPCCAVLCRAVLAMPWQLMSKDPLGSHGLPPWDVLCIHYTCDPNRTDVLMRASHIIGDGQLFMKLIKQIMEPLDAAARSDYDYSIVNARAGTPGVGRSTLKRFSGSTSSASSTSISSSGGGASDCGAAAAAGAGCDGSMASSTRQQHEELQSEAVTQQQAAAASQQRQENQEPQQQLQRHHQQQQEHRKQHGLHGWLGLFLRCAGSINHTCGFKGQWQSQATQAEQQQLCMSARQTTCV